MFARFSICWPFSIDYTSRVQRLRFSIVAENALQHISYQKRNASSNNSRLLRCTKHNLRWNVDKILFRTSAFFKKSNCERTWYDWWAIRRTCCLSLLRAYAAFHTIRVVPSHRLLRWANVLHRPQALIIGLALESRNATVNTNTPPKQFKTNKNGSYLIYGLWWAVQTMLAPDGKKCSSPATACDW